MHQLILHIGTHKTGSTALQQTLALPAVARALAANGTFYDPSCWPRTQFLAAARSGTEPHDGQASWAELEAGVEKVRRQLQTHDVLISDEGFSGTLFAGYADTGVHARLLNAITAGLDVRLIVYLRRQDSFIESAYAQSIHTGKTWSFDEFLAATPADGFDWVAWLAHYERYWPVEKISVFAYEAQAACGGIVDHFLPAADLATPGLLSEIERASTESSLPTNQGYSQEIIESARQANLSLDAHGQRVLRQLLQQTLRLTKSPFSAYQHFIPERRREFLTRFAASNATLRERFPDAGFDLWERPAPDLAPHSDGKTQLVALLCLLAKQRMEIDALAARPLLSHLRRTFGWARKIGSRFRRPGG